MLDALDHELLGDIPNLDTRPFLASWIETGGLRTSGAHQHLPDVNVLDKSQRLFRKSNTPSLSAILPSPDTTSLNESHDDPLWDISELDLDNNSCRASSIETERIGDARTRAPSPVYVGIRNLAAELASEENLTHLSTLFTDRNRFGAEEANFRKLVESLNSVFEDYLHQDIPSRKRENPSSSRSQNSVVCDTESPLVLPCKIRNSQDSSSDRRIQGKSVSELLPPRRHHASSPSPVDFSAFEHFHQSRMIKTRFLRRPARPLSKATTTSTTGINAWIKYLKLGKPMRRGGRGI